MAFEKMDTLMTNMNELGTLLSALIKSLQDHGGDQRDLNHLLSDAKNSRERIDSFVKKLIGPVWDLTEKELNLGDTRIDLSADEFIGLYSSHIDCELNQHLGNYHSLVNDKPPRGKYNTRLAHGGPRPRSFQSVLGMYNQHSAIEHADWRDLMLFASFIHHSWPPGWFHSLIIAAGSIHTFEVDDGKEQCVPAFAVLDYGDPKKRIDWTGVRSIDTSVKIFGPEYFYLIRVYE